MTPSLLAIAVAVILLGGCASSPDSQTGRPADFALEYGWSTGSIPPPYNHSKRLEVASSGEATFTASKPYETDVPSETATFVLEDADLDSLYTDLEAAGAFRSWREERDPPVGGSSWWLRVTADGQVTEIPSYVVGRQYGAKEEVQSVLEGAIPDAAQNQIDVWLAGGPPRTQ